MVLMVLMALMVLMVGVSVYLRGNGQLGDDVRLQNSARPNQSDVIESSSFACQPPRSRYFKRIVPNSCSEINNLMTLIVIRRDDLLYYLSVPFNSKLTIF